MYMAVIIEGMPGIKIDQTLLEAALVGLQQKRSEIEERISELKRQIGHGGTSPGAAQQDSGAPARKRPRLSAAARARIAAAQRKRWAALKSAQKQAAPQRKAAAKKKATRRKPAAKKAPAAAPATETT